ncbi:GcrA family cell cycle regulator [Rhizobium gallicum]|uniref:GcrA family cell cycle regulator n=1 Tax=Rhizobium gallicum TaxID=56730 RepID=UPI001EF84CAA|nr:GcrA family cell cycle regulator [Rhizobium gallicum]ULJ72952.1 GcrA cell cycle regulator [Rhizobium gallicum]
MNISTKPTRGRKIDIEAMAKLWNSGLSAGQIADRIGISRCAVSGHIHRHRNLFEPRGRDNQPVGKRGGGMKRQAKPHSAPVTGRNDGRRIHMKNLLKARMEAARREAEEFEAGTSPLLQIHVSDEERLATGKELHDLERDQCRWPLNNGSPFLFCADATGGALYCWHHMNRAYRPKGNE